MTDVIDLLHSVLLRYLENLHGKLIRTDINRRKGLYCHGILLLFSKYVINELLGTPAG